MIVASLARHILTCELCLLMFPLRVNYCKQWNYKFVLRGTSSSCPRTVNYTQDAIPMADYGVYSIAFTLTTVAAPTCTLELQNMKTINLIERKTHPDLSRRKPSCQPCGLIPVSSNQSQKVKTGIKMGDKKRSKSWTLRLTNFKDYSDYIKPTHAQLKTTFYCSFYKIFVPYICFKP
jgi:hypothetical protein